MISTWHILFALCAATIVYAYVGYPMLVWLGAKAIGRPPTADVPAPRNISIVIAAYNEAQYIARRVAELRALIEPLGPTSEIIIVSDGSTDGTDHIAREAGDSRVRVIQLASNSGKAMAINHGVAAACNPIIVLGDARQQWNSQTLDAMLENYRDPTVGAVSGDLVLQQSNGSLAGVGLYWEMEKWIRRNESLLFISAGVTGAVCSLRRELYRPLYPGTILDDVAWPMEVTMQGYHVIHEPRARAWDKLPPSASGELRRKIRTLAGNLQLVAMRPAIVLPWRNPVWFAFLCHKLLRLVVPWAMLGALVACAVSTDSWMRGLLVMQIVGYAMGLAALRWKTVSRYRLPNTIAALLILNAAAMAAWFVFFTGQCGKSWNKTAYNQPAVQPATISI